MDTKPIERACAVLGGQSKLAAALGVKPPTVSQWLSTNPDVRRPIPTDRCIDIEKATNGAVTCEELRPDVDWGYLRKSGEHRDPAVPDQLPVAVAIFTDRSHG